MKKILVIPLLGAALLLGTSCASGKKQPEKSAAVKLLEFSEASEKSGFAAAERFADGFAAAVKSGNFAEWQQVMPPHVRSRVNSASFTEMRRELQEIFGNMSGFRFLGTLRKGDLRDHLWVISFDKNGKSHEVIYLVRVYCAENGSPEISGFGVRRF